MPVFKLTDKIAFPDPTQADADGLLAVDGDLKPERLLLAYSLGIFPWYSEDSRIMWWSPNPRYIVEPKNLMRSKSLERTLRKRQFICQFDTNFEAVIRACAQTNRKEEDGTWITEEMIEAYIRLHRLGFAHSVEAYFEGKLVGGLYGVSLGKVFFGESMFFKKRDASKVALSYLCSQAEIWNFHFIDAQVKTDHLISLGAIEIEREEFLFRLNKALEYPSCKGKWTVENKNKDTNK
jgi:leucyl/phenylalanyl-tRNA--protein transferase